MTNTPNLKTGNAAVIQRMGRSAVMATAWYNFRKGTFATFAAALKSAWVFLADLVGLEIQTELEAKRSRLQSAVWAGGAAKRGYQARAYGRHSNNYINAIAGR